MSIEIKAPTFPESVADGVIASWHAKVGEAVKRDELLAEIETDKVVLEILAPDDGALADVVKSEGDTILSEELIALFEKGAAGSSASNASAKTQTAVSNEPSSDGSKLSPSARKMMQENNIATGLVVGTGKGGLVTKEDVVAYIQENPTKQVLTETPAVTAVEVDAGERIEKRVPMTRMRKRIAERLLDAKQNTAMLTTFNEVNMAPIMALRKQYKDQFEKTHDGVRLGFMSFFVKAAVEALKRFPVVNASIDGDDIVYHGYQDVGIAVSTEKGLVVPVIRDVDALSMADIEKQIFDFGTRARDGKIELEEMQGGTFTLTNGGVFGSLLSTPILNPPQAAILGMHTIQQRPAVVDGEIIAQPMMYLALSYDHRLIDGKDSVQFLVTIKEMIEDPARILLQV